MEATFTIPGKPKGKGRPRFGNGHTYTPKDTKDYEDLVKWAYASGRKEKWFDGPVIVRIDAYLNPSKSNKEVWCTKKPDCDNIAKIICDALNGVAYKDDSQIVDIHIRKHYTDGLERVMVEIYSVE